MGIYNTYGFYKKYYLIILSIYVNFKPVQLETGEI